MSGILVLPEGCIAAVISFTSPHDACRLACVSTTLKSAANSDTVWNRFLHLEYLSLISDPRSVSGLSKKELYLRTCHNLIHNGKLSFWFDHPSGKKCYMISPRKLYISNAEYIAGWIWFSIPEFQHRFSIPVGRFPEVVMRGKLHHFEIRGKINTSLLSPMTIYVAYLVLAVDFLVCANDYISYPEYDDEFCVVSVGLAGSNNDPTVYFHHEQRDVDEDAGFYPMNRVDGCMEIEFGEFFKKRVDGWLECELGEFFNRGDENGELSMTIKAYWINELLVQGIEIRPKKE